MESRLVASPTLHYLHVGGHPALFSETHQQLFGLNATADAIWQHLGEGRTASEACRELVFSGVRDTDAEMFVRDAVCGWLDRGFLTPQHILDQLAQPAHAQRTIQIHHFAARVDFFNSALPAPFDGVFGGLSKSQAAPDLTVSVIGDGSRFYVFEQGTPAASCAADAMIPRLKATFTSHYVESLEDGFVIHAALVARRNRGLLLCGSPGAGKTTLCVALVGSGYEYGSDDIVHVDSDGRLSGEPFAAAVKTQAWSIAAPYAPQLAHLPIHRRTDGQDVRYLAYPAPASMPEIVGVLLLARGTGCETALEPVEPLEGVSTLLSSAFSKRGAIGAHSLKAFARAVEAAGCYRLVYSELSDAVRIIKAAFDG